MKKLTKKSGLLTLGSIILVLSLIFVPHFAGAQTSIVTSIGVSVVTSAFSVIANIFNFFFGYIFMLAGWMVNIATELNHQILMDSNALVKVGWGICRDIANLGFVLIMIVMAVATIVRYEKYAVQKLLPLLIGAAILVNFSLTIAGVLITFSDSLSATFTDKLTASTITDALAGAFNPQRLLLRDTDNPMPPDPASQGGALTGFSSAVLIGISGLIFNIVFLAIATLSMATLALMLLYRYVYLSLLLVLAPLAWLFWVFPDLKYLFTDWWKNFIKWTFFLPASTFFLYLAVQSATALGKTQMFGGGIFTTSGLASIMSQGAQMIVLTFLLLGGLIAAQKLGIHGADGAMKLAKKGKDATLGAVGRYGRTRATNVGRRVLAGGVDTEGKTRFERWGASAAGRVPIVGAALTGLAGMSARARINNKKDLEETQKKTENRSGEEATNILNRQLTGGTLMSDTDLAAWGIKAAEKQKWGDVKPEIQKRIIDAVKRTNSQDKLLNNAPHLYQSFGLDPDPGKAAGKAVGKYLQDASKLDPGYLRYQDPTTGTYDNNIAINLRNSHIVQLANSGNEGQRQAVADAVRDVLGANLARMDGLLNDITAAKATGNAATIQAAKTALNAAIGNLPTDEQKAFNVYQNIQSNANWSGVRW
ncbi:MAG: hypothetical protein ABSF47_02135 [Minisyncoccia bacterium]|jgi:hypothetical protein